MTSIPVNKAAISNKLKYLRENNDLTIENISAHVGIQPAQLQAIEAGSENLLTQALLEKFANLYQVPLSYIIDQSVKDDNSYSFLTRAVEKLSENDHGELIKFAEFLKSMPSKK
jgi:transcriptional regulator with XRE-family HTH domain